MSKELILEFSDNDIVPVLFGEYNDHLQYLEKELNINISDRGNLLRISGNNDAITKAQITLQSLHTRLRSGELKNITHADIDAELRFLSTGATKIGGKKPISRDESGKHDKNIVIKTKNKTIAPRSPNQQGYLEQIRNNDMVFGLGPAGTGKTYLAVAAGVDMYLKGEVERLIFTRPAVEAGEHLGFLPGDMKDKIDPYLRPIYDALHDMLPWDFLMKKMEAGEIEIAPLAFMRGRTLAHSYVILDEAQNATTSQMKMFLTRMGEKSHMVITGDLTQSDLPTKMQSGLDEAIQILKDVEGIGFTRFDAGDVIRHALVRKIVNAYDNFRKTQPAPTAMSTPNIEIDIDIHDAQWENSVDNIEHTTRDAVTKALSVLIIPHADMEISIVLAGDDFIQELNKNYRGKDKPTNVLSFPMTTPEELENGLPFISLGDVIISFDTIKREASEQNKCFEHHYMHMLVHGCLHLLHYDHEIEEDAIVMESEEIRILEHFGIKNPYEVQQIYGKLKELEHVEDDTRRRRTPEQQRVA